MPAGMSSRDRARLLGATVDLDEGTDDLMPERAVRERLGVSGFREAGLDRDARVPRGAHDPGPAELGEIDRDEVGRVPPVSDGGRRANGSGSIASAVESPTGRRGAARRIAATAASQARALHRLRAAGVARVQVHREGAGVRTASASAASSAALSGTAGCSPRVRPPLRHAFTAISVAAGSKRDGDGVRIAACRQLASSVTAARTLDRPHPRGVGFSQSREGGPHVCQGHNVPGLAPERIKATLAEFTEHLLPRLEQDPGYQGVWAGVDFTGGRAIAVTYWESLDALHGSEPVASEVRTAAVTKAGVDRNRPPITDRYEVVVDKQPLNT